MKHPLRPDSILERLAFVFMVLMVGTGATMVMVDQGTQVSRPVEATRAYRVSLEDYRETAFMRAVDDTVPAFPGCTGPGCMTLNSCRDSVTDGSWGAPVVHKVTDISADTGTAGSILNILKHDTDPNKLDVILWNVGGVSGGSAGSGDLVIEVNCVLVAQQTARGQAALYTDSATGGTGLRIGQPGGSGKSTELVWGYGKLWRDVCEGGTGCSQQDNFRLSNGSNIVITNWDIVGGWDEVIGITTSGGEVMDEVQIANSVIYDAFNHPRGPLITSGSGGGGDNIKRLAFNGNLMWVSHRTPTVSGIAESPQDTIWLDVVNQVNYDWNGRGSENAAVLALGSYMRNYYKDSGAGDADDLVNLASELSADPDLAIWFYWFDGNVHTGGACGSTNRDFWANCLKDVDGNAIPSDTAGHDAGAPNTAPFFDYDADRSAADAYADIITNRQVGAYRYIDCDGSWVETEDFLLESILDDVRDSTLHTDQSTTRYTHPVLGSGWPTLSDEGACTDTDADGLPDAFEALYDCDVPGTEVTNGGVGDGYLCIEIYVWGLGAEAFASTTTYGTGVNIYRDTSVDTFMVIQPDGAGGVDTTLVLNSTNVMSAGGYELVGLPGDSLVLLRTRDGTLSGVTLMDSAAVAALCASTGDCDEGVLRDTINAPPPTGAVRPSPPEAPRAPYLVVMDSPPSFYRQKARPEPMLLKAA